MHTCIFMMAKHTDTKNIYKNTKNTIDASMQCTVIIAYYIFKRTIAFYAAIYFLNCTILFLLLP